MSKPLRDDEFYSDHGRHTLGLGHFWLFNPQRSRLFKALAIAVPVLVAIGAIFVAMTLATGVERS